MSNRDQFSSRLSFILIAAGCAIGLGNVWRFPYITGQYGGAVFVMLYLFFLLAVGIPYMCVEIAIGRASRRSIAQCYEALSPSGHAWHWNKWWQISGNYILMSFYGLITGWLLYYTVHFLFGGFGQGITQDAAGKAFTDLLADPTSMAVCMIACMALSFGIVGLGVRTGLERITKPMMVVLLIMLVGLAFASFWQSGFEQGIRYYLVPDWNRVEQAGFGKIVWAAMGQAFFTLSIGIGSIEIFGTYCKKDHTVLSEACCIATLDTVVALLAGFVIFPACFTFGVAPGAGPGLIFVTLTAVFSNIPGGYVLGSIFFFFMLFAAISTLITVYENIVCICMELFDISRAKSVCVNFLVILVMAIPVLLGFNVLSWIAPLGKGTVILDLQDFLISDNILPLGSVVFALFVTSRSGMRWENFVAECNEGQGLRISPKLLWYFGRVLPAMVAVLIVVGYISRFFS